MKKLPQSLHLRLLALAAVLATVGCQSYQDQSTVNAGQSGPQEQMPDPALANLAAVSLKTSLQPNSGSAKQQGASPQSRGHASIVPASQPLHLSRGQTPDTSGDREPPQFTAAEPPPPLPEYDQPPAPGDGYLWTPGYWAWVPTGYYWVPGVWVEAPYVGALWTPGYWGYSRGRYAFQPGHWGLHIGYYGGINYGFGYFGLGYEGGYWNGGNFNYNRVYSNVDNAVVHSVYWYEAGNAASGLSRISFNGGSDGVQVRPRPAELAANREPYVPRTSTQVAHEQKYRYNLDQFAVLTHGQPANLVDILPLVAGHDVKPVEPSRAPSSFVHEQAQPGLNSKPAPGRAEARLTAQQ